MPTFDRSRDDAEIAAAFIKGDPAAVALVGQWISTASGPFRVRLDAEYPDVLQEVRLEVLRLLRGSRWRGEARLKTYLWQVTVHTCLDAMRRRRRRALIEPIETDAVVESREPSPLDAVLRRERIHRLLEALESVPGDCRSLWSQLLAGASYREISERLGISAGALRVRVHRCGKRAVEVLRGGAPELRVAK